MRVLTLPVAALCLAASLSVLTTTPADAAADPQPPMNNFNYAFYACDGGAFQISYNSDKPTEASLTTNTNRTYELKRDAAAGGIVFEGGGAKFSATGKAATVSGTVAAFKNCKMKG